MPGILLPTDTDELASLHDRLTRLEAIARRRGRAARALGVTAAALLAFVVVTSHGLGEARRMLAACRTSTDPATRTLTALASAPTDGGCGAGARVTRVGKRSPGGDGYTAS